LAYKDFLQTAILWELRNHHSEQVLLPMCPFAAQRSGKPYCLLLACGSLMWLLLQLLLHILVVELLQILVVDAMTFLNSKVPFTKSLNDMGIRTAGMREATRRCQTALICSRAARSHKDGT
jgi:hypothetical protein